MLGRLHNIQIDKKKSIAMKKRDVDSENKREEAIAAFASKIKLNPNDASAYRNRGKAYGKIKEWGLAISDFSWAIELDPNDASVYRSRGKAYIQKKNWDLAISDCTRAIELDPDDASAYSNRGLAYIQKKNWDLAISDCTRAIELNPNDASAYRNRGKAYGKIKEWDLAISDFSRAIELDPDDAPGIRIGIASPEIIRKWSSGEVKNSKTIDKSSKPERDGLFCARIFGPIMDYVCSCGKNNKEERNGNVCKRCGVEFPLSRVRRERMGHIELAAPVAHIWFLKSRPSIFGALLDMTMDDLKKVIYFDAYVVIDPSPTELNKKQVISQEQYLQLIDRYGEGAAVKVGMGAEVIRDLLMEIDLEKLRNKLIHESRVTSSKTKKKTIVRRLRIVEAFLKSENKCEWMILEVLPVIPPTLRPNVSLDKSHTAVSDLNHLYTNVIERNNKLKKLLSLSAPVIIIRNEKRMLQEAVDALLDNSRREKPVLGVNDQPLKSLSDNIKGKKGRFRQNLLGKRVDYSGRSVIVVGPNLKLHQCGLPKRMALELFKPFVHARLIEKGYAGTLIEARKMFDSCDALIWDVLEEVVKEYPVLLNRAPTLHRLNIQAFEPILVEGNAIRLHPLVCSAFNADFDGDQMAVHVPLSVEANAECRVLMMSDKNILSPANGEPVVLPSQDIVLGLYYMTVDRSFEKGEGKVFSDPGEVVSAYEGEWVGLQARIKVRIDGHLTDTTPGRIMVGDILPEEVPFKLVNCILTREKISMLISETCRRAGTKATVILCDKLKDLGYEYSTRAGISIGVKDMIIPASKEKILSVSQSQVDEIEKEYREGIISRTEKYNKIVDVWSKATRDISAQMMEEISRDILTNPQTGEKVENISLNPIYMMSNSGARGNMEQMRQIAGMRGLMSKPSGEIIETPITSCFREGLTVLQYFTSTHGARKGLADTALKTADSGYLTRRLVDVVQDVVISEYDCGTVDAFELTHLMKSGQIQEKVGERALGRMVMNDVLDPETGEVIVRASEMIVEEAARSIDAAGINTLKIRSALTCKAQRGVCALFYGRDLARGHLVRIGEAVGIIAAQSIGEPGTQLTMRTFHIGGAAFKEIELSDIKAKNPGQVVFSRIRTVENSKGESILMTSRGQIKIVDSQGYEREKYFLPSGAKLFVKADEQVEKGDLLAEWDPFNEPFLTDVGGTIRFSDIIEGRTFQEKVDETTFRATRTITDYGSTNYCPSISICDEKGNIMPRPGTNAQAIFQLPVGAILMLNEGDKVMAGDIIARKPRESSKTRDIVGGLPRVDDLFEARKPKDQAVVAEIDGTVSFGPESRGMTRVIISPQTGSPIEYLIPKGKHIIVQEGDFVEAGELITDGDPDPQDILKIKGEKYLAKYLLEEIQEVYRLQGVKINDKHIEVVVSQMLKKVQIIEPGDTCFFSGQQVEKIKFMKENERCVSHGKKPAMAEPVLLGISRASLTAESFISAASFKETIRVLTEAAIMGKVDQMRGLKENAVMGRMIPAGTGYRG